MPNSRITASILQSATARDKALGVLTPVEIKAPRRQRRVTASELTTEAMVAAAGRPWLELNGWTVHRLSAEQWRGGGNRKGHEKEEEGTPDYVIDRQLSLTCLPFPFHLKKARVKWYWEAKRSVGGKIRQSQKDWAARHPEEIVSYANSFEELQAWVREYFPWVKEVCK